MAIWVWLKMKHGGLRRFWSIFPLADRVPFWNSGFLGQSHMDFSTPPTRVQVGPTRNGTGLWGLRGWEGNCKRGAWPFSSRGCFSAGTPLLVDGAGGEGGGG